MSSRLVSTSFGFLVTSFGLPFSDMFSRVLVTLPFCSRLAVFSCFRIMCLSRVLSELAFRFSGHIVLSFSSHTIILSLS